MYVIITDQNKIFTYLYQNITDLLIEKINYKREYSFFDSTRSNNKFFGNGLNKDCSIIFFKSYLNAQEYNNVEISYCETKSFSNSSIKE